MESPNVKRVKELEQHSWIRKHNKVKVFKASIEARRNIILLFKSLDIYSTGKLNLDNLCEILEFLGSDISRLELDQYLKLHYNTNVLGYSQFHDFVSINSIVDFSPVVLIIFINIYNSWKDITYVIGLLCREEGKDYMRLLKKDLYLQEELSIHKTQYIMRVV